MINVLDAAADSIAEHILARMTATESAALMSETTIVRGWAAARAATTAVVIVVLPPLVDLDVVSPTPRDRTRTATEATTRIRTHKVEGAPFTVVLMCGFRDQRDEVAKCLLDALDPYEEGGTGYECPKLDFTPPPCSTYLCATLDSVQHTDESTAEMLGDWRTTITLSASMDRVRDVTQPLGLTVDINPVLSNNIPTS